LISPNHSLGLIVFVRSSIFSSKAVRSLLLLASNGIVGIEAKVEDASFCCYYVGKEMEPRYSQVRRCVFRITYTSEYRTLQSGIDKRNKAIRKFQQEFKTIKIVMNLTKMVIVLFCMKKCLHS
jgi:hypothetical protein